MTEAYPGAAADSRWRQLVLPADYVNPTPGGRYNLVVIGAGPAGLITAIAAAGLGARVALIERHAMGGDCLNVGCVPSKALLHASKEALAANVTPDEAFQRAFAWLRTVRAGIAVHDSVDRYRTAGVDVYLGAGTFIDPHTIQVGDRILRTAKVVIATGARARIPDVPGLAELAPLTNESVFDLKVRPATLAVIGGGPIGCELAQGFARLGTAVTLLQTGTRILPKDDPEAAEVVARALAASGVTLKLGVHIGRAERVGAGRVLILDDGERIVVDEILVAAGRVPNIADLGLERIGIHADSRHGIPVSARLRTTCPDVYAIGDVASRLQFTHHADAQARIVIQNALFGGRKNTSTLLVPWVTYTSPELAHIGLTRAEAAEQQINVDAYRVNWSDLDRGRTDDGGVGYAEVLTRHGSDHLVGATLVGDDAGEHIAPLAVLMNNGLGLKAVGATILPYPTRSEYLRRLADAYNRTRLTPRVTTILQAWLRFARRG